MAAGASGGALGLVTNLLKLVFQWKRDKAEIDASKEAMRHDKRLELMQAENEFTRPSKKSFYLSRQLIFWDKKFGYETRKEVDHTAFNPFGDNRRMLTHYLTLAFCIVCLLWAIYPETIVYTQNFGENPKPFSLLWGFITFPVKPNTIIQVSTGSIVFGLLHLMSFIATFFFTQIRR